MAGKSKLDIFFNTNARQVTLPTLEWRDKFDRELFGDEYVEDKKRKLEASDLDQEIG